MPAGPIQGAIVGSPQAIQCIVITVSGVELSSIMISWMGPDGTLITDNSRIIVNPVTSFGNVYINTLHFIYLMEGDEGTYSCNVMILDTTQTSVVELGNLTCKHTNLITMSRNIFCWLVICIMPISVKGLPHIYKLMKLKFEVFI